MSNVTIQRIVDRYRPQINAACRNGDVDELLYRMVDDLAADSARLLYLQLETFVSGPDAQRDADLDGTLRAKAALASMEFGEAVAPHLVACLGGNADETLLSAARAFNDHLAEVCRSASAGGSA